MISIRSLGVLFTLLAFVHVSFAEDSEVPDDDKEIRLSFPGALPDSEAKLLGSGTPPTATWLKKERDRQLKQRGMRVTVWMEKVNVGIPQSDGTVKEISDAASCPVRIITNDLQCSSAEYGDISDVAITCRQYGLWDCSDASAGDNQNACRSKRKMVFKSAGDVTDKTFRVIAHAGSDPFPNTQFFSLNDLPAPLDVCKGLSGMFTLNGQENKEKFICRLKYDPLTQAKEGYLNVVKYTVFKTEVTVPDPNPGVGEPSAVRFQCPPVDPYFIIRR